MPRWAVVTLVVAGALVVLVPIGIFVGFVYVYGKNHENMRFPSEDVTVARCGVDPETRRPVAELSITSRAARDGTFTVSVGFLDGQGAVADQGTGAALEVAPGATGTTVVTGARAFGGGEPRCVVEDAVFASTGPSATATP
ncbi:hypothetical protein ACIRQY_04560 [Streptomyces sp. NPDC101490]|uniref:hypothetical protein n=1 Tax=Streptomyces sp. NPDC101490 TaxID=3366143 RepID=UPI0038054422